VQINETASSVQTGGERGDGPGHPRQARIQRVKIRKLKSCNETIFPNVKVLTHDASI